VAFNRISANNADTAFLALLATGASASATSHWYTLYGSASNMGSISWQDGLHVKITVASNIYGGLSVINL